jgi:hypothetical protein
MIDLDELIGIAGPVILVEVPSLKFIWLENLPEWWSQSTEITLPDGVTSLVGERLGVVGDPALRRLRSSMML